MTAMDENAKQFPRKTLEVKIAVEEGDKVATFSKVVHSPGENGRRRSAHLQIRRREDRRALDVGQAVPDDSPNQYGMF